MKLIKILTAFIALASLQIAAAQWLNVPPPAEAKNLMIFTAGVPVVAGADYTATVAKIYMSPDGANHTPFRISVYGPDYALIATTNEGTTVDSSGTISLTFASNPTLSASGTYWLAISSGTNYFNIWVPGTSGVYTELYTWNYISMTYPTFPDPINLGGSTGSVYGAPAIWLENAAGQKIVGDNVTTGKEYSKSFGNDRLEFHIDGYTRATL